MAGHYTGCAKKSRSSLKLYNSKKKSKMVIKGTYSAFMIYVAIKYFAENCTSSPQRKLRDLETSLAPLTAKTGF